MLSRRRRMLIFLIAVVPAAVFIAAAGIYVAAQISKLISNADKIAAYELHKLTNREVRIKHVDTKPLGIAVIRDIHISNGKSFKYGELFSAEKIIIKYRWLDMALGRVSPEQCVDSIEILSPKIHIERLRNGNLNIQDLLMIKPVPGRKPFRGYINIKQAEITFVDHLFATTPSTIKISNLSGEFDAAGAPFYVFAAHGKCSQKELSGKLSVSGSFDIKNGATGIDVSAEDISIPFASKYLGTLSFMKAEDGRAAVQISTNKKSSKGVWQFAGNASVKNTVIALPWFSKPAVNVNGRVQFSNEAVGFNVACVLAGSRAEVNGTVTDFKNPALHINIASKSTDFDSFLHSAKFLPKLDMLKTQGKGSTNVQIAGKANALVYQVSAHVPNASIYDYSASNINAKLNYSNGRTVITAASAWVLGGEIRISGRLEQSKAGNPLNLAIAGSATGLDISSVPVIKHKNAQGFLSGNFVLSGTTNKPKLDIITQLRHGKLNKIKLGTTAARLVITKTGLEVKRAEIAAASGIIKATGTIKQKQLNINMQAQSVDLLQSLSPFGIKDHSGTVDFSGSITGTLSNPVASGTIEIYEWQNGRYHFDYANADITASENTISLSKAHIRMLPTTINASGQITNINTKTPSVDLLVDIQDAPAEHLLEIAGLNADIRGTVSGNLNISGISPNIAAHGRLNIVEGSASGYPIKEAHASLDYKDGQLLVSGLEAKSDEALLTADGSVNKNGEISIVFLANNIALSRLNKLTEPYASLSGSVNIGGTLTGTTKNPKLAASLTADHPSVNSGRFEYAEAELGWSGTQAEARNIKLLDGSGSFEIKNLVFNANDKTILVENGSLNNFSFPTIYGVIENNNLKTDGKFVKINRLLAKLKKPNSGIVNGSFSASGSINSPKAKADISLSKLTIGDVQDAQVDVSASADNGRIDLNKFEVQSGALNVSAYGSLLSDGTTDVEMDVYNLDLNKLSSSIGRLPISGTATARASIKGLSSSPDVTASIEILEPNVYGVKLDRIRASQITISKDSIDLSRAIITKDTHSAVFYGTIPWSWTGLELPADKALDLHAVMENQTLDILPALAPLYFNEVENPGLLSASFDLTGTLKSPVASGSLKVADGKLSIRSMTNNLVNLQADFQFDGNVAGIRKLSGDSSDGGSFEALPGGRLTFSETPNSVGLPSVDVAILLKGLRLGERNLFGYKEEVRGKFESDANGIKVSGKITSPNINGNISVSDGEAVISPLPENTTQTSAALPINPSFDLNVNILDNFRIRNPSLIAEVQGRGLVKGSLTEPDITGGVRVVRGQIVLPTQRMRITQGEVSFAWNPKKDRQNGRPTPPQIRAKDLVAKTSVMATSPSGTRQRYNIILTVNGPVENLTPENVGLESDPAGLSRTQILAALGRFEDIYGGGELALSRDIASVFTMAVSPIVFNRVEWAFAEAFGLEELSINYAPEEPFSIYASSKLFDSVYMSYWRIMTGGTMSTATGTSYSWKLTWRPKDWLEIGYATDSSRIGKLEVSYRRRF